MFQPIKNILKRTPMATFWYASQEKKKKKYIESISSAQAIYPFFCIYCNKYYKFFDPLSSYYEVMLEKHEFSYDIHKTETLNTAQYSCPGCGINDRDRLCALFLQKAINSHKNYKLIEFAPSLQLSGFIRRFSNIEHRTADLFMKNVDDKADLLDLHNYENNSFDVFICSHILEHVDDDVKAMSELYRILKPGGFGIAMVPLFAGVEQTDEDPLVKDEATRWKRFGQDDHIRLYKKSDYVDRLKSVGFVVHQYDAAFFGEATFDKNGLSPSSILYVVEK